MSRAHIEKLAPFCVGATAAITTLDRASVTPQRFSKKIVKRAAGKGFEAVEILGLSGEGNIFVVRSASGVPSISRTRLMRPTGVCGAISSASATSSGAAVRSTVEATVARLPADRADQIGERAHRVEPAPDQPVFVRDKGADAMLDVDEVLRARESAWLLASVGRLISRFWASATSLIRRAPGFNCPEAICSRSASATRLTRTSRDEPDPLIFSVRLAMS